MFGKSEAFDEYVSGLIEEKLKKLKATDGKYVEARYKADFEAEIMSNDFNYEDFLRIEDFRDLLCDISDIENRYLYVEGFKDCLQLLTQL